MSFYFSTIKIVKIQHRDIQIKIVGSTSNHHLFLNSIAITPQNLDFKGEI